MKKPANLGHVLTIIGLSLSLVVVPLITWALSIEKREQNHSDRIENVEKSVDKKDSRIEFLFDKVNDKLDEQGKNINAIRVELQNKQNRN